MAGETQRTGLVVSGAMHLALLAALTLALSRAPRFEDAPESVPVETITPSQLNEIMRGEKDAKPAPAPAKPAPAPPAKPAPPKPEPPKPEPPAPEPPPRPEPLKPDPTPPEPPKRPEPPRPEPPPPEPPKRPEPPKPAPPKPAPPKPQAEDAPGPPPRPRPEKAEETPRPPERPRPAKTEEPPKPAFKSDEIARALARDKAEAKPEAKPQATPKSNFDPTAISRLLGPTRVAEAPAKPAPQGLPTRQAPHMSVSLENALNEWFRDSYKNCWNVPPSNPTGENYVFDVRVTFNPDGSLAGRPVMLNPPRDPEWRAHADSALRAVMRCNPLRVPPQYAPYFDQWRTKTIHFDPSSAEG